MNNKSKVLIVLAVVLVVALGALAMQDVADKQKSAEKAGFEFGQIQDQKQMSQLEKQKAEEAVTGGEIKPLPTVDSNGSVETITSDIAQDFAAEDTIMTSSDNDLQYLQNDLSAINTNDIYNDNQF